MCLGVPGRILDLRNDALRSARVAFGEVVKTVSLALGPEARVGQYVVVHAGTALEVLDEAEALDLLKTLLELEETS